MTGNHKSIWILNHYANAPDMPGGTRCYSLGQGLRAQGYDVTIFASSFVHLLHREMRLAKGERWKTETVDGIRYVWLRTFPYQGNSWRRAVNMISYMCASYRVGRSCARRIPDIPSPQIIIGSSVHLLAALSALFLAEHFGAHFVMEVRDVWSQALINMNKLAERSVATWAMRQLEHFLYRRAERVIVLLPGAVSHISGLGIPQGKIVYIPNGVDLSLFSDASPQNGQPDGFRIVYLGSLGTANNLDVLLDAMQLVQAQGFPTIQCDLIGDGALKPQLIARSRELGLRNTRFLDPVPRAHVPDALGRADAGVFVSADVLRLGVSARKLFDYMASEKPIIFSGDTPHDIVQAAQCGLSVPFGDPEMLANAIIRLYRMSSVERKAMGQQGRAYVEQHHDHTILAQRLAETLEGLFRDAVT